MNIKTKLLLTLTLLSFSTKNSYAMEKILNFYVAFNHPSVEILRELPHNEKHLMCHDYAFLKTINQLGKIPAQGGNWHNTFNILDNYFIEIDQPQENDLVIYKSFNKIMHTGIVHASGKIESKWGPHPCVYLHLLYDVPNLYGTDISYYRLNVPVKTVSKKVTLEIKKRPQLLQQRHNMEDTPRSMQTLSLTIYSLLILGLGYYIYQ